MLADPWGGGRLLRTDGARRGAALCAAAERRRQEFGRAHPLFGWRKEQMHRIDIMSILCICSMIDRLVPMTATPPTRPRPRPTDAARPRRRRHL